MSFLDTARRALGGKPDDYYEEDDRYEDEYEEYDDDEPKKSFFSFLSKRNDEDDEYEEEAYEKEPERARRYSTSYSRTSANSVGYSSLAQKTAPTPVRSSLAGVEVIVHYPASLDDATRIIREVKSNKITIFDISSITSDDEARRVVDYIGGAAFGMDCPFERLCPSIFCIAPVGVKIDAKKNRY